MRQKAWAEHNVPEAIYRSKAQPIREERPLAGVRLELRPSLTPTPAAHKFLSLFGYAVDSV